MPSRAACWRPVMPGLALDVGVGVAMRHAERGGQLGPDRGLAAPHQPDQHDVSPCRRSVRSLGYGRHSSRRQTGRASRPRRVAAPTRNGTPRSRRSWRGASTRDRCRPRPRHGRSPAPSSHRATGCPRSGPTARPRRGSRSGRRARGVPRCRPGRTASRPSTPRSSEPHGNVTVTRSDAAGQRRVGERLGAGGEEDGVRRTAARGAPGCLGHRGRGGVHAKDQGARARRVPGRGPRGRHRYRYRRPPGRTGRSGWRLSRRRRR